MGSMTSLELSEQVDKIRIEASKNSSKLKRKKFSQYFTGHELSNFMAGFTSINCDHVRILDPGAGVGPLTASVIEKLCRSKKKPLKITAVLFEVDTELISYLKKTIQLCDKRCCEAGIVFESVIYNMDFIEGYSELNVLENIKFNLVIMNPPYKKINRNSKVFGQLSKINIESKNLYAAFLTIALRAMEEQGQLIAIVPRSFCNGTTFKPFRIEFLRDTVFKRVHIFNSRTELFSEDGVLQENIILMVVRSKENMGSVLITSSNSIKDIDIKSNNVSYSFIVQQNDPDRYIRLPHDQSDLDNVKKMMRLKHNLLNIGVNVSTGKVVDFRAKENLSYIKEDNNVPLIYPNDFVNGQINWSISTKKPNLIQYNSETKKILIPSKYYVVVKRFSAKEEKRRVVAAIYDYRKYQNKVIGFENHLNYIHMNDDGLQINLAKGLVLYLNSTHVDTYFRQFSGVTQVNARDLINLRYPSKHQLMKLGSFMKDNLPTQNKIDRYVEKICFET